MLRVARSVVTPTALPSRTVRTAATSSTSCGSRGPFDPEELTEEYAALCKQYRCSGVTGDKYAREWVASAWRKCGVVYTPATLTASETYLEASAVMDAGARAIPDHPISAARIAPAGARADAHGQGSGRAPKERARRPRQRRLRRALWPRLASAPTPTCWARPRDGRRAGCGGVVSERKPSAATAN